MARRGRIDTLIADAIAARVREEMADWGERPGVRRFAEKLQTAADQNNTLVEGATITLENLSALFDLHAGDYPRFNSLS